jgi:uncharacterized membrane protein
MTPDTFLDGLRHDEIVAAIREAEATTSGEIRVFVSRKERPDALAAAKRRFLKLGMDRTEERNAVLIYVAPRSRSFAVVGDTGVHAKCGETFWVEAARGMESRFRAGEFTEGIVETVRRAAGLLSRHFPRSPDDRNELPDGVVTD